MLQITLLKQIMTLIKEISLLLLTFCFCSCQNAEKTDYIFPINYEGWAIVFYNIQNGKKFKKIDNRTTIEIPQNGVLFTSNKRPEGILHNKYFLKVKKGKYKRIYSSLSSIPRNDSISSYVLVESYQSIKINMSYYLSKNGNYKKEDWLNYDEMVIFKIKTGFSDTVVNKKDVDRYLDSIIQTIIKGN